MAGNPAAGAPSARVAVIAAIAVGAASAWNVSNVGAVAVPLVESYRVSLVVVGLFTTALFLTYALAQVPAGRAADRLGARRVCFAAVALILAGNVVALVAPNAVLALGARALEGVGSGAGLVAAAEYMRSVSPTPLFQGIYGASNMAGGGLAIAVVPPYWAAVTVVLASAVVLAVSRHDVRGGKRPRLVRGPHFPRLSITRASTTGRAPFGLVSDRQAHTYKLLALGELILVALRDRCRHLLPEDPFYAESLCLGRTRPRVSAGFTSRPAAIPITPRATNVAWAARGQGLLPSAVVQRTPIRNRSPVGRARP